MFFLFLKKENASELIQANNLSWFFILLSRSIQDVITPVSTLFSYNTLHRMVFDSRTNLCGHGFRTLACSALIESGIWQEDVVELQMSHMEKNNIRAAYTHKAKHLEQRHLMLQWWADFQDANR